MNRPANLARPRGLALAAAACAFLLTGCGSDPHEAEIARQVEIAKQAADRAVAAQHAAEAAAQGRSAAAALTGTGFRRDSEDEPKFGEPTDGNRPATADEAPRANPGEASLPGSVPPPSGV